MALWLECRKSQRRAAFRFMALRSWCLTIWLCTLKALVSALLMLHFTLSTLSSISQTALVRTLCMFCVTHRRHTPVYQQLASWTWIGWVSWLPLKSLCGSVPPWCQPGESLSGSRPYLTRQLTPNIRDICVEWCAFSAFSRLVGRQEGHLACKNWVVRYWRGCLSGARCKWFAYGPTDATATLSSLAPVKSRMVYLSGASLPRFSWKRGH